MCGKRGLCTLRVALLSLLNDRSRVFYRVAMLRLATGLVERCVCSVSHNTYCATTHLVWLSRKKTKGCCVERFVYKKV